MTVYPVPGHYLNGIPAFPTSVTKAQAERLIRTGAFTDKGDSDEEPLKLTAEGLSNLDYYDPPDAGTTQNQGPVEETGPSDSEA